MSTLELGTTTLKGYMFDYISQSEDEDMKWLYFICPNPNCHSVEGGPHIITVPITKKDHNEVSKQRNSAVWQYQEIEPKKISVSPSILQKEDFHVGYPTYFELVDTKEELYKDIK